MSTQASRRRRYTEALSRSVAVAIALGQLLACGNSQPDPDTRAMSALLRWIREQGSGTTEAPSRPPLGEPADDPPARSASPPPPARPAPRFVSPPATPLGLRATVQSASEVVLAWNPSTDPAPAPAKAYELFERDRPVGTVTEPRYVVRGLRPAAETCYSVRAVDAAGRHSTRTAMVCFSIPDTAPPSVPARVSVAPQPHNGAAVSWLPSSDDVGVVAYEVSRGGGRAPARVATTSFVDHGLATLSDACYTIVAVDAAGNRSMPSPPACTRIPDTRPPTVPSNVVAEAPGEREIVLTWAPSSDDVGVVRYEIARAAGPATAAAPVTVASSYARLDGLSPAVRYCHAVRACDAAGNCSEPSAPACTTTPDLTPPTAPSQLVVRAASDRRTELRWAAATDGVGVAAYEIDRGGKIVARAGAEPLAYADDGVRPGREYCYRVHAVDAAGNRSSPSPVACATTPDLDPPSRPGHPAAVAVSSTQLFLAWDASTDDVAVAGYEVLHGTAVVEATSATRARVRHLAPGQEYCYSVRAFDAAGNRSEPAGPFCGTTSRPADLAAPSDLRVRRVSPTAVLIQWEPSEQPGVTYVVYSDGGHKIGRTGSNTFTPSGTLGAKPNCYKVVAVDATGRESTASNQVCATATEPGPQPAG
jgi:fibronectin type 3 domain-containing protein